MNIIKILPITIIIFLVAGCQETTDLAQKQAELKQKKTELNDLRNSITSLEAEIAAIDPEFAKANRRATLITTIPVEMAKFESFIEVSGAVESRRNVILSAELPGIIEKLYVTEGQAVKAGQTLIKLENETLQRNFQELKTNYNLAKTMYERQANLWEKNIGTEMQYLEAKNRKEALENQLRTINTQIQKTYIKAPFNGTIDLMEAKLGMLAQPAIPLIRIVSLENLYIKADVSEAYIGVIRKGEKAKVSFASLKEEFDTEISSVGQVIDPDNRSFSIELQVPLLPYELKPNLISIVKIKDFEAENVAIVPTNLIQKDNHGDFVYVVVMNSETPIAKKVRVIRGRTYKNKTMIEEGLTGEEELVDEGFREVSEGINVNVVDESII